MLLKTSLGNGSPSLQEILAFLHNLSFAAHGVNGQKREKNKRKKKLKKKLPEERKKGKKRAKKTAYNRESLYFEYLERRQKNEGGTERRKEGREKAGFFVDFI